MSVMNVLAEAQGGALFENLGRAHGLSAEDTAAVLDAVVPRLSESMERNTLSRGGLADLVNALGHGHHEAYVDDPRMITDPTAISDGNAILGHLLGTKDRSRGVADKAEAATGVSADVIRGMLPVIAGMVMGGLSRQVKQSLGGIMDRVPQGGQGGVFLPKQPLPRSGGGSSGGWGEPQRDGGVRMNERGGLEMPDTLPPMSGGGGADSRAPRGGDPLPMPGNRVPGTPGNADNPFGDLAEILRRGLGLPGGNGGPIVIPLPGGINLPIPMPGGTDQGGGQRGGRAQQPRNGSSGGGFPWPQPEQQPGTGGSGDAFPWPQPQPQGRGQDSPLPMPGGGGGLPMPGGDSRGRGIELPGGEVGGGALWNIIRSIIGAALGFQSRGVLGWIMRMIVMKYGWTILRTILGRGVFGR